MKLLIEHNGGLGDAILDTAFIKKLKEKYKIVKYFKPKSSRQDSSEIYIIAINFNH